MRKLLWGKSFVRAVKRMNRRNSNLLEILKPTFQLLADDPFAPQLETHKLKGKLSGSWACKAGYILSFIIQNTAFSQKTEYKMADGEKSDGRF